MSQVAAIVLAAGKSTRMKSDLPKVRHEVCGRPMLYYVLSACRIVGVERLVVVVGHRKDEVVSAFDDASDITWVEQAEQKGTGHAVLCCREVLEEFEGSVLVIAGDMPLVRRATLAGLHEAREESGDAVTMATTVLDDPSGYGRIVRDADGNLEAIVEDADCTPEQRGIREVNPSYYCFDSTALFDVAGKLEPSGPKAEYYITGAIHRLRSSGHGVSAPIQVPAEDAMGINSRTDLAAVGRIMQDRLQRDAFEEGVTIVDPDNTWIEAGAQIGRDTTIWPFTFVGAEARIGKRCRIGPFAHVAAGSTVVDGDEIGPSTVTTQGAAGP